MPTPNHNWPVFGHDIAVQQLDQTIQSNRIGHAYMFTGLESIGKTTLAIALAMRLNCLQEHKPCGECRACLNIMRRGHPDLLIVESEHVDATLKINQIRELQRALSMRPYEAQYKVAIVRRFHEAAPVAQDAILKTLEEPASNVVIVLTVGYPDRILPTIFSRCQVMNLRPLPLPAVSAVLQSMPHEETDQHIELLSRLSGGRVGWAIRALNDAAELDARNEAMELLNEIIDSRQYAVRFKIAEKLAKQRTELKPVLSYWMSFWRDLLLIATGSKAAIINVDYSERLQQLAAFTAYGHAHHALEATREAMAQLERNANARLCLEVLMLRY